MTFDELSAHRNSKRKEALIASAVSYLGYEPQALTAILKVLAHPDVIADTITYFEGLDTSGLCEIYEAPMSCIEEAQARFDNAFHGWAAGPPTASWSGSVGWCGPCRVKAAKQRGIDPMLAQLDATEEALSIYSIGDSEIYWRQNLGLDTSDTDEDLSEMDDYIQAKAFQEDNMQVCLREKAEQEDRDNIRDLRSS